MTYKLGSLFDGSGGFPLAGSLCGIEPAWASEVEPYPIAVTRNRFPNMKHLGDISKINGGKVEPVDIITFGSPCQDLSVAGKRAGLKHEANGDEETTRSGLFMEAVRIIKEMREATNGRFPAYALWENVPGAFSSNKGEDFRIVLEELIKIVEPSAVMPAVPSNGWPYADSYCGDGWSLAYRVFDAQYWGVPQRRRRIHLVLDLRGERAREVLFEREGVRGYFAQGRTPWQAAAGYAENCAGADDRAGKCYGVVAKGNGEAWPIEEKHTSLSCGGGQAGQGYPCAMVPYTLKIRSGCEGGGKGALVQEDKSATLATNNDQYLFQPIPIHDKATRYKGGGPTRNGDGAGNGLGVGEAGAPAYTVTTGDHHAVAYLASGKETVGTLMANAGTKLWLGNQEAFSGDYHIIEECAGVDCRNATEYPEMTGALQADAAHNLNSNNVCRVRHIVRRLTPTECARLQGFADRWGDIDEKTEFSDEEYRFWLEVRNTHATVIGGREAKEYTKEQMLKWYNSLHTDSAEYKMWGNGIALPPALYCMQGIADTLRAEEREEPIVEAPIVEEPAVVSEEPVAEEPTVEEVVAQPAVDPEKEMLRETLLGVAKVFGEMAAHILEVCK